MLCTDSRFQTPSPAIERRIDAIIAKLTLEEKIDLLGGHPEKGGTRGNKRAGIPELKMADGPSGVHWWTKASTTYPAGICAAASWDRDLMYRLGAALGSDARARGIHILLAPGVNIYRSPLCGRNFEYLGEDPCLAARMVVPYIKGVQSKGVAATVKHYAVNYQEFDRHGISSDVDERTLHEVYLPAFKAAVIEAGAGALMTAYNLVNGVHCSEHKELIVDILKDSWGFDGVVMSDWDSTYSAVEAAMNGLDLEMPWAKWMNRENLLPAVREGKLPQSIIDDKIRRRLRMAICFGWLDNDQIDPSIPLKDPRSEAVALDVARGGIVLLKNERALLPLDRGRIKKLAVVGASAHPAIFSGGGSAYSPPTQTVSILEGIRDYVGDTVEVVHMPEPDANREWRLFETCAFLTAAGTPGLEANIYDNEDLRGEPILTRIDERLNCSFGRQGPIEGRDIPKSSIRWSGAIRSAESGEYLFYANANTAGFRLIIDGECILDSWAGNRSGTLTARKHLEAGRAYSLVLEMRALPGHWIWMRMAWEPAAAPERDRKAALEAIERADAAIICTGFDSRLESESYDRPFGLGGIPEEFIAQAASVNPNIAVVVTAGGNIDMERWIDNTAALLYAWYPGQTGGTAIAEILFGATNPSGKLPATFERALEDRSSFSCYHDDDRDKHVALADTIFGGYRHFDKSGIAARFPFGFGLSYTAFAYENLRLSSLSIEKTGTVAVEFDIVNTGARRGAEIAQLYIGDPVSKLPRPVKELKNFAKVDLAPGERARVVLAIAAADLMYYDPGVREWVYEPGDFEISIGASSRDIRLREFLRAV